MEAWGVSRGETSAPWLESLSRRARNGFDFLTESAKKENPSV